MEAHSLMGLVDGAHSNMMLDGKIVSVAPCLNCGKMIYWNAGVPCWLHVDTGDRKCTFLAEPTPL